VFEFTNPPPLLDEDEDALVVVEEDVDGVVVAVDDALVSVVKVMVDVCAVVPSFHDRVSVPSPAYCHTIAWLPLVGSVGRPGTVPVLPAVHEAPAGSCTVTAAPVGIISVSSPGATVSVTGLGVPPLAAGVVLAGSAAGVDDDATAVVGLAGLPNT
jgi:hypothetical protein